MRLPVTLVFIVFVSLWMVVIALLLGEIPATWLPKSFLNVAFPESFADLGNAMTTLDGLFSSIAIVLGLIAILFQGKELKESTNAQAIQAAAMTQQIQQQTAANILSAYSARLSFLSADIELMEVKINDMVKRVKSEELKSEQEKSELWEIIKHTRRKQQRYRKEAEYIDSRVQKLLEQLDNILPI